jgi:integrase
MCLGFPRVVLGEQAARETNVPPDRDMVAMLFECGLRRSELLSVTVKKIQQRQAPLSGSPAKRICEKKAVDSSLFTFMYFRSSTRGRFPLQFDLIVINGGTDEIF